MYVVCVCVCEWCLCVLSRPCSNSCYHDMTQNFEMLLASEGFFLVFGDRVTVEARRIGTKGTQWFKTAQRHGSWSVIIFAYVSDG